MKLEERSRIRKEKMVTNLARNFGEAEQWDIEFWKKVGSNTRLGAMWDMVYEVERIRGHAVVESRLQRSVETVLRNAG
jgi:hypothetical protein